MKKVEWILNKIKYMIDIDNMSQVSQVLKSAKQIPFDDSSKIVLMSDCHRGDGSWADNFAKNQNIYITALNHYYNNNFTYIEIGDGDELWENKKFEDIIHTHSDVFWLFSKFFNKGKLYLIYGNHDIVKKNGTFSKSLNKFLNTSPKHNTLFEKVKFYEGLVLKHNVTENKILLIHGHQVDFLNHRLWRLSRFLVRYLWKPVETFGINDPTSTAKNYTKKRSVEKKLIRWVTREKHILITGHTHRPIFPKTDDIPYFNDGSCVHPRCITAIEIDKGHIILVKWCIKTKKDGTLYIGKEILEGPVKLKEYFKHL